MRIRSQSPGLARATAALCIFVAMAGHGHAQPCRTGPDPLPAGSSPSYERITAHLMGVYGPRGYFNLIVGLYSCPIAGLHGAQFNVKQGLMVLDVAPGFPRVSVEQMHHIETISGYSPGPVEIQEIKPDNFAETGPGWRRIQPPQAKSPFARWITQNFVNHHY
ncbi:MAG: hypothetical protein ACLGQU_13105 [Acidobacteriota bacterium]